MKRDMDLVRRILQVLEQRDPSDSGTEVKIEGRDRLDVWEHLRIMEDALLVEGVELSSTSVACDRMTWQGYEFLEASRDDSIWTKAKAMAMRATGGLSLEVVKAALIKLATDAL